MDGSLYRFVNRLADRTGFAHPFVVAYAKYGLALFAVLLGGLGLSGALGIRLGRRSL